MRTLHTALVLVAIASTACEDEFTADDITGSTGTTLPSGTGASSSSSGPAAGGGGGDGGASSSSGVGGAGGQPPDLSHEVRVFDQSGTGVAGVAIVVHDASGAVLTTSETGGDGSVVLEVPEDGSLAAFWEEEDGSHRVYSVHQPPLGALVRFSVVAPSSIQPTSYEFDLSSYPAGTSTLRGDGACDFATAVPPNSIQLDNAECTHGPDEDFLFIAESSAEVPLAWATIENLGVNPGGTVSANVTLDESSFVETEIKLNGAPADATYGTAGVYVTFGSASFSMTHGVSAPSNNVPTVDAKLPSGAQFTHHAFSFLSWSVSSDEGSATYRFEPITSWPASTSLDASVLPRTTASIPDLADAAHPVLSWQTSAASSDMVIVEYRWEVGAATHSWTARLPPDALGLRLGDVPDELAGYRPGADWDAVVARHYAAEAFDGYADAVAETLELSTPAAVQFSEGFVYPP